MRKRVAIVDDDEVMRRGVASVFQDEPRIETVATLDHDEALAFSRWGDVDVAVVDAGDERRDLDHFPGVGVVEAIRRIRSPEETMVVVVTGYFLSDGLRRRMREAQADFFYHRTEIRSSAALCNAVLRPELATPGVPDLMEPEVAFRHGVTSYSRVNRAVAYAVDAAVPARLSTRGVRSRSQGRLRTDFNRAARLEVRNADGTVPNRAQDSPSASQIERFLTWATRPAHRPR